MEPTYLRDWRVSAYFQKNGLMFQSQTTFNADLGHYRWLLDHYGGAPAHVATLNGLRQACEIAQELSIRCGRLLAPYHCLVGLAHAIAQAHKEGKVIHSLAFIAARLAAIPDGTWYLNLLSPVADTPSYREAEELALEAVTGLETFDFPLNRAHLLASRGIECLSSLLRKYGPPAMIAALKYAHATGKRPPKGSRVLAVELVGRVR